MRYTTTDGRVIEVADMCAHCQLDTGGNHQSHCPLYRSNYTAVVPDIKVNVTVNDYIPTFPEAWNKLCPQGWAWLIGDCDFGQNCGECKEPEAPIYAKTRGSSGSAKE